MYRHPAQHALSALLIATALAAATTAGATPRLDPEFLGGQVQLGPAGSQGDFWTALAIQDDGRIVSVGSRSPDPANPASSAVQIAIGRTLPDGRPDSAFGEDGRRVIDLVVPGGGSDQESLADVRVLADGRLLAAGFIRRFQTLGTGDALLVRLLPNGQLDSSYGSSGAVRHDLGPFNDVPVALLPRTGGGFWMLGDSAMGPGSSEDFQPFVAAVRDDGSLDPGFAAGGVVRHAFSPGSPSDRTVFARGDGDGLLAWGTLDNGAQGGLWRVRADGTLDAGFGTAGVVRLPVTGGSNVLVRAVADRPGGYLVLLSASVGGVVQALVHAIDARGRPDPVFPGGVPRALPASAPALAFELHAVAPSLYLAVGRIDVGQAGEDLALWALDANGNPVERFAPGGFARLDTSGANRRDVYLPSLLEPLTGKLVVGGGMRIDTIRTQFALARITTGLEPTPAPAVPSTGVPALIVLALLLAASAARVRGLREV
ncbi:MAG: hypothetical protein JNL89_11580 [Rhodanobacteraceae bacterium]|nr:hypothetical protein [Rhodanobacteraceae bacterium]